ncbi:MAG: hypothetical protein ABJC07_11570 [Acidobacteriota bacterium]
MLNRARVEIAIDRRRPERVRVLVGPPEACVLVRTCTSSEEVFEYLWLVLRVPPELAAVKVAELKRDGGSLAFEYDRLPELEAPSVSRRPPAAEA